MRGEHEGCNYLAIPGGHCNKCSKFLPHDLESAMEEISALRTQLATSQADCERWMQRTVGCGVAALQNTEKSCKDRITKDNEYYSASYQDVCNAIDREIDLRAENVVLSKRLEATKDVLESAQRLVGHFEGDPPCRTLETGRAEDCNCGASQCHYDIIKALSLLQEGKKIEGWRPRNTAPKNENIIIALSLPSSEPVTIGWMEDWEDYPDSEIIGWLPLSYLPALPETGEK